MLLSVADTPEAIERTRKMFMRYYCFTYCAVKEDMLAAAEKYKPSAVLLRVEKMTEELVRDAKRLYEILPDVKFVIVSDDKSHDLPCAIQVKARTCALHIVFHTRYYMPRTAASGIMKENHMISGLYFNTYFSQIRLFGYINYDYTLNDGFLLRFLAEQYPRRVSAEEIAECCFGYGKKPKLSAVTKRISRINQRSMHWYNSHDVIKYFEGEGYQIDF